MPENAESKRGILKRRAAKRREKALRTGDTPDKIAERGQRHDDPVLADAKRRAGVDAASGAGMSG